MAHQVDVRNVSHIFLDSEFRPSWALKDVSLTLEPKRFTCILGPSGCGKTTLLHLIAGFMAPTSGEVVFAGRPVTGPGPDRSVVFQEYALFEWMTVRQNVEFGMKMQGVAASARRARADELLSLVRLPDAADRYPYELSGGMRQRIAVARAIAGGPSLLLMDEPFAAVDAMTRTTLQEELLRIWREIGLGIVFITHNIDEAIFLAEEIVLMTPNPGSISRRVAVDLPHPRDRSSPEFGALYSRIGAMFHAQPVAA